MTDQVRNMFFSEKKGHHLPHYQGFEDALILTGMLAVPPAPNLAPASKPPSTRTVDPGG